MPKISAPTVAEHRANQRGALVRAGEEILLADGIPAVTPRSVSERAGMSRSSFYDYFPTKDDLLVAIAIDAIERWDAEIEAALEGVEPGLPRLRAFVEKTMEMTADGKHEIAGVLREAQLSPSRYDDVMALHDALMRPLMHVVEELGVAEPRVAATLAEGVLGAGVRMVSHGLDHARVADDVYRMLTGGLRS